MSTDRATAGFVLAAATNALILVFSKGLQDDLGAIDPLFSPIGCLLILLWGAAYLAVARNHAQVPAVAAVFAVEKLAYTANWGQFLLLWEGDWAALRAADPISWLFLSVYGLSDAAFMLFFGWVAWRHRARLFARPPAS